MLNRNLAEEPAILAPSDDYDVDSEDFLAKVETEWWRQVQGDLGVALDDPAATDYIDREMRDLVVHLASVSQRQVAATRDAVDQYDAEKPLPGNIVTADEMARRVVSALVVLLYGGKA